MPSMPFHHAVALRCRDVASALLGGLWIGRSSEDVAAEIEAMPVPRQAAFTLGALAFLLGCSFFAAQFGLLGLALFWLAVVLIIA